MEMMIVETVQMRYPVLTYVQLMNFNVMMESVSRHHGNVTVNQTVLTHLTKPTVNRRYIMVNIVLRYIFILLYITDNYITFRIVPNMDVHHNLHACRHILGVA